MFKSRAVLLALTVNSVIGTNVAAKALETNVLGWDLTASGAISVQGAAFSPLGNGPDDQTTEWDASLVLNAERVTSGGLVYGFRGEIDTGNREVEDLQRDELYAYVAGEFGRIEVGEQDGPADTMSYHAPLVGLGQIQGDFSRYTGDAALLSAVDTRDSLKALYLSAPLKGFRFGVSYAPEYVSNENDPNPRRRTIQENAVEVAIAYQASLGDWAAGVSVAHAFAEADPITQRQDLDSWSFGGELRRDKFSIGGAYVKSGDSNSLVKGLDEEEVNIGVAWRDERWGVAVSASERTSIRSDDRLIGAGAYFRPSESWELRADFVSVEEDRVGSTSRSGHVALAEIAFLF